MLYSCTHVAPQGVKGLITYLLTCLLRSVQTDKFAMPNVT